MKNGNAHLVRLSVSLALISVSIIAFQLVLIQILSIVQWYHFAYMVISVAMLGFGTAGTFISLFRKYLLNKIDLLLPWLMVITSLLMSVSVTISQTSLFSFDSYRLFADISHLWKLIATYMIFLLPFFFGALAIGLIFVKHVDKIGTFYFANMLGSGIGGTIAVGAMWWFFPEKLPAVAAIIALFAGLIIFPKQLRSVFFIIVAAAVTGLSYFYISPPSLNVSEYKSISKILNLPGTKIIKRESSPYGTIEIVSTPYLRYAPGLSIKYPGMVTVNNAAFNNGDWLGPLISSKSDSLKYITYSTEMIPYIISKRNDVLVLSSGTGRQVNIALLNNTENVIAVEPNKSLLNLLSGDFSNEVDSIYNNPSVQIRNISARTFLKSSRSKFDVITLPIIGAFGGTSGMFALQEQYLLTKEAFGEMWSGLTGEGVISITTWIDYPYRNPLKLIASFAEVLEQNNKNPIEHIAAIKNWNTITFAIKRTPFNGKEIKVIREFCNKMNFDPFILPGIKADEREKYNKLQDKSLYTMIDKILASPEEREKLYSEYPFNIKPAVDDKPYFSQFLQWKSISQLSEFFGNQFVPFFEVGYVLLYLTFILIVIFALILIILPLVKLGWKGGKKSWALIYFSGLGTGYMFIEIIFIQQFTLYFGNVIYSAAAVVSLMLISSGFGSLVSQKLQATPNRIIGIISFIVIALIIYTVFLPSLLKTTIVFTLPVKIIITALLIAPSAFFMGMPFPLGLRMLSLKNEIQVPWAWGINGVFSVISTVLATIIAIELGFVWVMIFAAGAYSLSLLVNLRRA